MAAIGFGDARNPELAAWDYSPCNKVIHVVPEVDVHFT